VRLKPYILRLIQPEKLKLGEMFYPLKHIGMGAETFPQHIAKP
jgi:hypothetical protein